MRYWDPSAIVPMLSLESTSHAVVVAFERDRQMVTWWASLVECTSAIARRARLPSTHPWSADTARTRLRLLSDGWTEVGATDEVRQTAMRLLRTHPLRTGDALQLAAAIAASEGRPPSLTFVTLDDRLADAASKEGFPVLRPGTA